MATRLMQITHYLPRDTWRQFAGAGVSRLRNAISTARPLPRVPGCTLGLLRDPYRFVMRTCARLGVDAFEGRVLFRRTVFLMGEDAALLFYNPQLFERAGALPLRLQRSFLAGGGLQSLEGPEHRRRKALLMDLLAGPESVQQLGVLAQAAVRDVASHWPEQEEVDVYRDLQQALARAACAWAGLPLADDEVEERSGQIAARFDQARLFGPAHWSSWWQRRRAERWVRRAVADYQAGRCQVPEGSVLHALGHYRDGNGQALPPAVIATEVLNVIRPMVAISVYGVFMLMALETWPRYREQLRADDSLLAYFAQEVRRFYPFFPHVAARSRTAFEWNGLNFPAGVRVMLDLYGTNHDTRRWEDPDVFHPERFLRRRPGNYAFVPQGGGDPDMHHRCPGEDLTQRVMEDMARLFTRELRYELATPLPPLDWGRLPPLPEHRLRLLRVAPGAEVIRLPGQRPPAEARPH